MLSREQSSQNNKVTAPGARRFLGGVFVWLTLIIIVVPAAAALALNPVWGEPGVEKQVPDIESSLDWYQEVSAGSKPDIFLIEAAAGQRLQAGVSIPRISGLEDFQVNMVLLGPGLPEVFARDLPEGTALSQDQEFGPVCEGTGTGIVVEPESGEEYFEPLTQTSYLRAQQLDMDLPESGTYYLVVAAAGGGAGKYVLHTGGEDSFSAGKLLSLPVNWVKVHLFFGHGEWLIGGLVALIGFVAAGSVWVSRRRRHRLQNPARDQNL